ncbi:MAG: response regulator [Arcobacter sp.]|uniref:response regulator n=1 Tax=Arcobacter sp. TaxID=1872629 RepID=UPI003B00ED1E
MNKTKILIVEDESIVALDMQKTLMKYNYNVSNCVTNYDDAIKSVKYDRPDIILMDINLGKSKDGIEVVEEIQTFENIPIIYITAFSDEDTISRAIKTNPVSYLLKPFKREELKSNIMLGLYKNKTRQVDTINKEYHYLGNNYYFDNKNDKLFYKDLAIKLGSKEILLLKILIESKEEIVSFEELESRIWTTNTISDSTLRTLIYRLRGKLEYKLIETIPNMGCRILVNN